MTVTFDGPVTAADFTAADFEVNGTTASDAVTQSGANAIVESNSLNPAWNTPLTGDAWDFANQPGYVAPGQSGTVA